MTRIVTCSALVTGLLALATTADRVYAQPPPTFEWQTYTKMEGGKNVEYKFPSWSEDPNTNTATLQNALGKLAYPENPTITKVVMKVYKGGVNPGSWTPVIEDKKATAGWQAFPVSRWYLAGTDPNLPQVTFKLGENVKFAWELETTDQMTGKKEQSVVDVYTTAKNIKN